MGCCLSKKKASSIPHSTVTSCDDIKSPDPSKPDVNNKPTKPVIEQPVKGVIELRENPAVEEEDTISEEKVEKEEENGTSKKRESESVVRTSSCTKEEVDAILIQCGKLSRSNSAAKTRRRYSGSKRSFDLEEEEAAGRKTPQGGVERVNGSPRERRRRTPSRERGRNLSGSLVISRNTKFVTVPATDTSSKRVTNVKRSIGEACRTAAMSNNVQSPYRRRTALGEIDQNGRKGDKKMVIKREDKKPQVIMSRRSRSLRKSRDFDLLQSREEDKIATSSYTALLLKDIKNFHGKKSNDDEEEEDPFSLLPSCVTKACSIVEAVADLMEPSFEKYVTVKRVCCSSLEETQ
ncbi:hypothetical protein N665_7589s0001 [Sinapis alba]|nr:hypothetical protein N665_7589s0001 [Sinapis alba]